MLVCFVHVASVCTIHAGSFHDLYRPLQVKLKTNLGVRGGGRKAEGGRRRAEGGRRRAEGEGRNSSFLKYYQDGATRGAHVAQASDAAGAPALRERAPQLFNIHYSFVIYWVAD